MSTNTTRAKINEANRQRMGKDQQTKECCPPTDYAIDDLAREAFAILRDIGAGYTGCRIKFRYDYLAKVMELRRSMGMRVADTGTSSMRTRRVCWIREGI